ncbi:Hypothetical predicted protein [Mytilus galloprovincialis]|nr:Hypothetical predicted protein [Mytilus galloprovincialis]
MILFCQRQQYIKHYPVDILMKKGIKDNQKKQKSEKIGEKKIRKKEYMRKFMQMRGSNTDYAERERISLQNRRLESKFKHFEIDYNKKRRTDPEFFAFEKEHNKKRWTNPEFVANQKSTTKRGSQIQVCCI